jgi:signal transduction histidine kinase
MTEWWRGTTLGAIPQRDAALAGAIVALGQLEVWLNAAIQPKAAAAVCELVLGAALAWRRKSSLAVVVVVSLAASVEAIAHVPLQEPLVPLLAVVIAVYSLVTYSSRERAAAGAATALLGLAVQTASQHKGLPNFAFGLVFLVGAWIAGRTIHARTARAAALEREHATVADAAAEDERRRIARELHDVIAHSLGVLVLQAGAAEQILEHDPDRARETLRSIRATGNEAIAELGTLLAVARGEPERSRHPQPRLSDLGQLVAGTREAGLPVEVIIEGRRRDLPPPVELSAYRIVQEGLTNALKHAAATQARVVLRFGEDELEVHVEDNGVGAGDGGGSRRGLAGIGERVALFGGRFHAGAESGGGWRLQATLPLPR